MVPIYFPGRNTRLYQIMDKISATVRQGLLLHEIVHALNKPQAPIIGDPLKPEELEEWKPKPREFMNWLRSHTLALGGRAD